MCKRVSLEIEITLAEEALMFLDNLQRADCENDNIYRALLIIKDKIKEGIEDA